MSSIVTKLSPSQIIQDLLNAPEVIESFRFFEQDADAITEEHIAICEIPASPFDEQARAEYLRDKLAGIGLSDVTLDGIGNCIGIGIPNGFMHWPLHMYIFPFFR